jgi:hypothetical protein
MTSRDRHLLFGLAALTVAIAMVCGLHSNVLLAVPVLLVALPLVAGWYVGEERLARLAAAFVGARRRAAPSVPTTARRSPLRLPRGGRLIAASLAVRPPPPARTLYV